MQQRNKAKCKENRACTCTDGRVWVYVCVCICVARPIHTFVCSLLTLFRCFPCAMLMTYSAYSALPVFTRYTPPLFLAHCSLTVPSAVPLCVPSNLDLNLTTNNLWLPSHNHLNLIVNNTQIHTTEHSSVCVYVWVSVRRSLTLSLSLSSLKFFQLSFGNSENVCISISRNNFSTFRAPFLFCNKFMNHICAQRKMCVSSA